VSGREYMAHRLRLLSEGRELAGTPEQYIARHDQALVDLLRLRSFGSQVRLSREIAAELKAEEANLDLVGG
jgi:hypothetical protein